MRLSVGNSAMNTLSKRFNVWRRRRHLERVAGWEHTRLKGKARFVIRSWIVWSTSFILATSLYDYYAVGHVDRLKIVVFFLVGPIVGFVEWWIREGEYTAAKIDERRKAEQHLDLG